MTKCMLFGKQMRGKRPSSHRKAEAETMVFANSVSSIMRRHEAAINANSNILNAATITHKHLVQARRNNALTALDSVDALALGLPETFLDERLQSYAAVGALQAGSMANLARTYNTAYDANEVISEQLPDKLIPPVLEMAKSNAVRTGTKEGKGFRGKRKPSRGSLFDVMEAPARKKR